MLLISWSPTTAYSLPSYANDASTAAIAVAWSGAAITAESFAQDYAPAPPGPGVWNMHDRLGGYHMAQGAGSGIQYSRSDLPLPPAVISVAATTGADSEPRMSISGIERIHLSFTRAGTGGASQVMLVWSDDDGATWKDPPMALFDTGKHPANAATDVGTVIHAAYIPATGTDTSGTIQAVEEIAPEQWTDPWTFVDDSDNPLHPDDDSFSFSLAREGAARWVLVGTFGGTVQELVSADDCRTWTYLGSTVIGP